MEAFPVPLSESLWLRFFRNIEKIEYQIDHHKIHFVATPSHTSFWNRVKDAFIGEVDE